MTIIDDESYGIEYKGNWGELKEYLDENWRNVVFSGVLGQRIGREELSSIDELEAEFIANSLKC